MFAKGYDPRVGTWIRRLGVDGVIALAAAVSVFIGVENGISKVKSIETAFFPSDVSAIDVSSDYRLGHARGVCYEETKVAGMCVTRLDDGGGFVDVDSGSTSDGHKVEYDHHVDVGGVDRCTVTLTAQLRKVESFGGTSAEECLAVAVNDLVERLQRPVEVAIFGYMRPRQDVTQEDTSKVFHRRVGECESDSRLGYELLKGDLIETNPFADKKSLRANHY